MKRGSARLVVGWVMQLLVLPALAQSVYFVSTGGVDSAGCTNAQTPCATIAYAINQASDGDAIEVAAGIYTESGILLDRSISIVGQSETSTIIQAASSIDTSTGRVFEVSAGVTCAVENVTLRHGYPSGFYDDGGCIRSSGALSLRRVTICANSAYYGGESTAVSCSWTAAPW